MIAKRLRLSKGFLSVLMATAMVVGLTTTLKAEPPNEPPGSSDHAIVPLGKAFDTDGREVEGIAFIHYKRGFGHKPQHGPGGRGGNGGGGEKCFALLAKGARWKTTEQYVVNPTNMAGLNPNTVKSLTAISLETWNTEVAFDIFGLEDESSLVDGIDTISPDGKNEFLFGPILENGVIAVTVVWGIFSGPPFVRELVEWDSIFEDIEFAWSTAGEDDKMDFQNIARLRMGLTT